MFLIDSLLSDCTPRRIKSTRKNHQNRKIHFTSPTMIKPSPFG